MGPWKGGGEDTKAAVPCDWVTWRSFGMELNRQPTPFWVYHHPFLKLSPNHSLSFLSCTEGTLGPRLTHSRHPATAWEGIFSGFYDSG